MKYAVRFYRRIVSDVVYEGLCKCIILCSHDSFLVTSAIGPFANYGSVYGGRFPLHHTPMMTPLYLPAEMVPLSMLGPQQPYSVFATASRSQPAPHFTHTMTPLSTWSHQQQPYPVSVSPMPAPPQTKQNPPGIANQLMLPPQYTPEMTITSNNMPMNSATQSIGDNSNTSFKTSNPQNQPASPNYKYNADLFW